MLDRVAERRRAAQLARHYRDQEGLSIAEIARRLGRAQATIKSYLYDPTGDKARAVKARYRGVCRGCGAPTAPRNGKRRLRVSQTLPSRAFAASCTSSLPPRQRQAGPPSTPARSRCQLTTRTISASSRTAQPLGWPSTRGAPPSQRAGLPFSLCARGGRGGRAKLPGSAGGRAGARPTSGDEAKVAVVAPGRDRRRALQSSAPEFGEREVEVAPRSDA